jgi:putative hydrolase of the HAD superfamily
MNHFPNIIFDLGGVIINLSYQATIEKFSRLCGRDMTQAYSQAGQVSIFDDLETGRIGAEQFWDGLRDYFGTNASNEALADAWNAMLLDIPPARIQLLEQLKAQGKRTFLLSNTNGIHKPVFYKILEEATGYASLEPLFEKCYLSHEVGDRKPNASIFMRVLEENGLDPAQTLFIEDSIQHIEGARKVGIQAYHLTPPQTILELNLV